MYGFEGKTFDEAQLYRELTAIRSLEIPLREDLLLNALFKESVIDSKRFFENYSTLDSKNTISNSAPVLISYLSEIAGVSTILKSLGKSAFKLRYSVKKEPIGEILNHKKKAYAARANDLREILGGECADLLIREFTNYADAISNKKASDGILLYSKDIERIAEKSKLKSVNNLGPALGILSKEDWLAPLIREVIPFTEKNTYSAKYRIGMQNARSIHEFRDYWKSHR